MSHFITNTKPIKVSSDWEIYEIQSKRQLQNKYSYKVFKAKDPKYLSRNLIEIDILFRLVSPNLAKGYAIIDKYYSKYGLPGPGIISDLGDGNLTTLLARSDFKYYQREIAAYQLVKALECLHSNNYLHLNICSQNVIFKQTPSGYTWKLSDFSNSAYFVHKTSISTTRDKIDMYYKPIESFNDSSTYSNKSDIFSLGMVLLDLFNLNQSTRKNIITSSRSNTIHLEMIRRFSSNISTVATLEKWFKAGTIPLDRRSLLIDLVSKMLNPIEDRYNIRQVLNHPFWTTVNQENTLWTIKPFYPYIAVNYDSNHHTGLQYTLNILREPFYKNKSVELLFLVIDIYIRIMAGCGPFLTELEAEKLGLTALLMATKIHCFEDLHTSEASLLPSFLEDASVLEEIEDKLVNTFDGRIGCYSIFEKAQCLEVLLQIYKTVITDKLEIKYYLVINTEELYSQYMSSYKINNIALHSKYVSIFDFITLVK